MRRTESKHYDVLRQEGDDSAAKDYPFVSPCGPELNFVRPADASVIVFHSISHDEAHGSSLVFGGNLLQSFDPSMLAISASTGRLYHELVVTNTTTPDETSKRKKLLTPLHDSGEFGLVRSSLAVTLSENITVGDDHELSYHCPDTGQQHRIQTLPASLDSGSWTMPFTEE
jgi:hypothetical protein